MEICFLCFQSTAIQWWYLPLIKDSDLPGWVKPGLTSALLVPSSDIMLPRSDALNPVSHCKLCWETLDTDSMLVDSGWVRSMNSSIFTDAFWADAPVSTLAVSSHFGLKGLAETLLDGLTLSANFLPISEHPPGVTVICLTGSRCNVDISGNVDISDADACCHGDVLCLLCPPGVVEGQRFVFTLLVMRFMMLSFGGIVALLTFTWPCCSKSSIWSMSFSHCNKDVYKNVVY